MNNYNDPKGDKAILGLFAVAIVVVIGIVMYMGISQRRNLIDKETGVTADGRHRDLLSTEFEVLKDQINDENSDLITAEEAVDEFVTSYGRDNKEATELRFLLNERKNAELRAMKLDTEMRGRANEIKRLVHDSTISREYLESATSEFIARFGEERNETRELRRLLRERKLRDEKTLSQEETIVSKARDLISRINDDNESLRSLQTALSEFIIEYGDDRKEIPELRRLLDERKQHNVRKPSRESVIADEAKELVGRISNRDEDLNRIETDFGDFLIRYGEERKEIPELRRFIKERKEAERLEALMARDTAKLMGELKDPEYSIHDLEQAINDFIDYYGADHEVVLEFNHLLAARKEEENQERTIAKEVALLRTKIGDQNYTVDELRVFLDTFINTYGERREEVPDLQIRLRDRREGDLRNRLSREARELIKQIKDRNNTIDSLQESIDRFMASYGENHNEIQELQRFFDDRQSEEAITEVLSSLDGWVMANDTIRISSVIDDRVYADKLKALTEWPGLIFRHNIQFFQRDGDAAEVRVELENGAEHVPKRKLYFNYRFLRDHNGWRMKTSEKITH